jgi:hypothetical protein
METAFIIFYIIDRTYERGPPFTKANFQNAAPPLLKLIYERGPPITSVIYLFYKRGPPLC